MTKQAKIGWLSGIIAVIFIIALTIWQGSNKPEYPEINTPRPSLGSPEAKIIIEEFSDFQCSSCGAVQPLIKEILNTFSSRVVLYYKHFPLVSIHPYAFRAALASECANDQGKFWEYHDLLFTNQNIGGRPRFDRSDLIGYSKELKLDSDKFTACLDSRAKDQVVRNDMQEANNRNLNSTPTFFVNGEQVQFEKSFSELKDIIQKKLLGS